MSDDLGMARERSRQQRLAAIKHWVAYITAEPPETWGPQQNAVVDDQLAAAQHVGVSAAHHRAVSDLAKEIAKARDDADQQRATGAAVVGNTAEPRDDTLKYHTSAYDSSDA